MISLSHAISKTIIEEYGQREFLRRLSDPLWFQAFGCVLGFDWHSSGVTTVVARVLKQALKPDTHGISIAGGKGKKSMTAKDEIPLLARNLGLSSAKIDSLLYASRMAAKVDSAAVQDGYSLYHHVIFFDEQGDWAVVQQGMNAKNMTARRYHWLSDGVQGFVCEPHAGIISESKEHNALDMTAANSQENQKICVDLACGDTNNLRSSVYRLAAKETLDKWCAGGDTMIDISSYEMPRQLNWHLFKRILISSQEIMKSFYRFSVWRAQLSERCHSSPSLYTVHELHGTTLSNTALPTEVNVMYRIPLQERSMTNRYATFTTLLKGRHTKRGEDRSAQETCKIFNQDISQRVRLK